MLSKSKDLVRQGTYQHDKILLPLDLTVNGYAKRYLEVNSTKWCSDQVLFQLDNSESGGYQS